jgi:hypothetical protein
MGNAITRLVVAACLIAMVLGQTGCMGTQYSRLAGGEDHFGKWPYQAVATDCLAVKDTFKGCFGKDPTMYPVFGVFGFVSLPVDCVVDTILLPLDLVLWPCGYKKNERLWMSF